MTAAERRARILIVDDNEALVANLRDILEGARELSAEVATTHDGRAAILHAAARGFDVALVDVKLPDMSGVDVVRRLREANPRGEVVLVTGFATVDSAIAALEAGAFAFLLKSFRPEELVSTVEQAFAKTELVRAREELEARQRALIETAGVLIVGVDRDGRVALSNPKTTELTAGLRPDGRAFVSRWIGEESRERISSGLARARSGERGVAVEATLLVGEGAPPRRIEWQLSGVPGDPDGLVYGIGVDVTERRALERRAAEAEALSAMSALALGLAHEIRNPLNAAVLQLHLLARATERVGGAEAASMRDRVGIVETEIRRLERLLTDFLELARPRSPQFVDVDLGRLAEQVLALEAEALRHASVAVIPEIAAGVVVAADAEKLKQVWLNLLANARAALSPGGGTVWVRVVGGDAPRFEIEDDGPGIDPSVRETLFDAFVTTKPAGTGLGLAIVRRIVQQHGGAVSVASGQRGGALVTVELPEAGPRPAPRLR
ncbi:MAG: response regulator [Polyangiaceae bacterium]|nr:response regulator [Polyangiaceae bacterium]